MSSEDIDRQLEAYLREEEKARRKGYTIENVLLQQQALANSIKGINARVSGLEADRDVVHDTLDNHGAQLVKAAAEILTIKRRVRTGPEDEEMSTGRFNVEEIQRELSEMKKRKADSERAKAEEIVWWRRSLIGWGIGVLAFVATTALTILITMAVINSHSAPPPSPAPALQK